jgi:hypothetical protein
VSSHFECLFIIVGITHRIHIDSLLLANKLATSPLGGNLTLVGDVA